MNTQVQEQTGPGTGQRTGGYCRLEPYRTVKVGGADARDFLNRQLTCDLNEVNPGKTGFGAWCTPKGRIITLLHLIERPGGLYLLLPAELLDDTLRRLRMFVMRDDVVFEPEAHEPVLALGLIGEDSSGRWPGSQTSPLPVATRQAVQHGELTLIRWPGDDRPRLVLLGTRGALDSYLHSADVPLPECYFNDWRSLDIRAGVPEVFAATREAFIPQMLNLERIGGVSFTKGCYPGQEIVARTQHLGRIKRRMYNGRLARCDVLPAPGSWLVDDGAEPVARVVSSAAVGGGGGELLAVVPLAKAARRLYPEGASGPNPCAVELRKPIYGFDDLDTGA